MVININTLNLPLCCFILKIHCFSEHFVIFRYSFLAGGGFIAVFDLYATHNIIIIISTLQQLSTVER